MNPTPATTPYLLFAACGLPRSGKTTRLRALSRDHGAPIVNPDSIRLALHGQRFVPEAERFVWATAHCMVQSLFLAGHPLVLVDATNTTRKRRQEWQSTDWQTVFLVMDTPREECLRRAGDDEQIKLVIERMAAQWEPLGADEIGVDTLGTTGLFPRGQLNADDEGEIRLAIAADRKAGIVRIEFGKPVGWLGLPAQAALELAERLSLQAAKLS